MTFFSSLRTLLTYPDKRETPPTSFSSTCSAKKSPCRSLECKIVSFFQVFHRGYPPNSTPKSPQGLHRAGRHAMALFSLPGNYRTLTAYCAICGKYIVNNYFSIAKFRAKINVFLCCFSFFRFSRAGIISRTPQFQDARLVVLLFSIQRGVPARFPRSFQHVAVMYLPHIAQSVVLPIQSIG